MNKIIANQPIIFTLYFLIIINSFFGFTVNDDNLKLVSVNHILKENYVLDANLEVTPATVCFGAPIDITFTGTGGNGEYTFYYTIDGNQTTEGPINGNSTTVNYTPMTKGDLNIVLTSVAGKDGIEFDIPDQTITIKVSKPEIDFAFNNDDSCAGSVVQFTSNATGIDPLTYQWSFGDGINSSSPNPSHEFLSALGCGTQNFNVTLTVTDDNGCSSTITKSVTVIERPDITFNDLDAGPFDDPFNNCGNNSTNSQYSINVGNNSTSSCITSYNVDWGDNNSESDISFPINHTYLDIGTYIMTITAVGNNGCETVNEYNIKNSTTPGGSLGIEAGTTNLCLPDIPPTIYTIGKEWATNPIDTDYILDFGDGTIITLHQEDMIQNTNFYNATDPASSLPYQIEHIYTESACPNTEGFNANLRIETSCDYNSFSAGPTKIYKKPEASFDVEPVSCTNESVQFMNQTNGGYGFAPDECSTLTIFNWDFGDPDSGANNSSTLENPIHNYTQPGVYTINLTASNSCGESKYLQTICIESPVQPLFNITEVEGCTPFVVPFNNTTDISENCGIPEYLWSITYTPGFCGTSSSYSYTTGGANASEPTISFDNPGTYSVTLTATNSCGSVTSSPQEIIVKPPPQASITPVDDVCGSATITPIATVSTCSPASETVTYIWSFPGGSPASSPELNPGTINYPNAGDYQVTLSVTNSCGTTVATQNFKVNPEPVITNADLTQTICSGSITTEINILSDDPSTTFSWSGLAPAGVTGFTVSGNTSTIPSQTISNSNTTPSTLTYTVIPSLNGCPGEPVLFDIIINPSPEITEHPISNSICQNGITPELFVNWQGTGTPTYQWYEDSVDDNTSGTAISGATASTFSPPTDTIDTTYYYVVITFTSGGCNQIISNTAAIEVTKGHEIDTEPMSQQSICVGGDANTLEVISSGGTGVVSYQWYSNTTNSNTGGIVITGATTSSYAPGIFTLIGSYYYYVVISVAGSGCGDVTSEVSEIIVVDDPVVTSQPLTSQEFCQNAIPEDLEVIIIGGLGNVSYQWYSNTSNSTIGGTLILGATSSTYTPLTTTIGTLYYYVEITQDVSGCATVSNTAEVIVLPAPTIENQPISDSVCLNGTTSDLEVTYTNGTGTPTYQWYENSVDDNMSGTAISGATASTFSPPTDTIDTTYYYVVITFTSGGCNQIISNTVAIEVTKGPEIDTQPMSQQSICIGGDARTLEVISSGGTGVVSYQWYLNSTNSKTGGTLITGANNNTYTPNAFTTTGNFYYYVIVSLAGNGCGDITSEVSEIEVVEDPVVDSQPFNSQELCQNSVVEDLEVTVSDGLGNVSYQWYSNTSNFTTGGNLIAGAVNNIFTPPSNVIGRLYYYCVISQDVSGCGTVSDTAEVIVTPAPTFTNQPESHILCLGDLAPGLIVSYINGTGVPSYKWYQNTINDNTSGTEILGEVNSTFTPSVNTVGTIFYYSIISFSTGGCSEIISDPAEITINETPKISFEDLLICSNNAFEYIPNTSNGDIIPQGTLYTWTAPIVSPAGSVSGVREQVLPITNIAQMLVNTTINPSTVTYTVTPISGNCVGNNFDVVVTVNPSISVVASVFNSNCYQLNSGSIDISITGGVPFNSGPPYEILWSGPRGFTSTNQNLSNLVPGNYVLTIDDMGGCPYTEAFTITEPEELVFSAINYDRETISCFGANDGSIDIEISGGTQPYRYYWTKNGADYASTQDLFNLTPGNYKVIVSDAKNCTKTAGFNIIEPLELEVDLASKVDILCFGKATGEININAIGGRQIETSPGNFDYNYSWSGPKGYTNNQQNISGLIAGTYTVTVTDKSNCTDTLDVVLNESEEIIVEYSTTKIKCYGDNNASIIIDSLTGGNPPYNIFWSNLGSGMVQNNLSAGTYTITVIDNTNCQKTKEIMIEEAPIFTINPIVNHVSCFGENDAEIQLNLDGGINPVALVWDDDPSAGLERNNIGPGVYTVTITDGTPCEITETFIITEPAALGISANTTDALNCDDANSGDINLIVTGGTLPLEYSWSNGAITEDLINVPPGNYTVTVTDTNGCEVTDVWSVNRFTPLEVNIETVSDYNCETREVKQNFVAKPSGGVPPYQITWSNGDVSGINNEIMTTTEEGLVIIIITDSLGCETSISYNVDIPVLGDADYSVTSSAYSSYGFYSIHDPIQFTNTAIGDYVHVSWNFGDGNLSSELNPSHVYTDEGSYSVVQTVTYPFGCVYTKQMTLVLERGYSLIIPNAFTPNDDGLNDYFVPESIALSSMILNIYDTWGSLIYSEAGDNLKGWNGKIKGTEAENGNYYFTLEAKTLYGETFTREGAFVSIK